MRRVAGVFPLDLRLGTGRGARNGKPSRKVSSRKIHASTWSAALAVALLCVGAALIVAGLVQSPEPGARLLPHTAHLPLKPNETPNRAKKAAREASAQLAANLPPEIVTPKPEIVTPLPEEADGDQQDARPETGRASWYDLPTKTASGEMMDGEALTAAHNTLPLGSHVRVANLDNGRAVVVRINDRGPFAKDRIIDLSKAAAEALGMVDDGVANVRVTPVAGEVASLKAGG
jgi:peptidoglycan lytic transglycosylase